MGPRVPPSSHTTPRRWRVPPPPPSPDEVYEGLGVLDDVPGEAGLVLWQALRDAMLWARADRRGRAALFAPGAGDGRMAALLAAPVDPALERPLAALAAVVSAPPPAREETVGLACREVAQWLEAEGLPGSALAFARAAAVAMPGDPAAAFAVGRLARRQAEHTRADAWLRRTVVLARQGGDWHHHARAYLTLGALALQRGNLPAARRHLARSLHSAERRGVAEIRAMALHDLFAVAAHAADTRAADEYAARAVAAYGAGHPDLPRLAHDVAWFWVAQGWFARALPVLRSVLPHFPRPGDRALILSLTARAAGGTCHAAAFAAAHAEAVRCLAAAGDDPREAGVLLELAHGALNLGEWGPAEQSARRALRLATRRGEGRTRLTAEALLDAARRGRTAGLGRATRPPPTADEPDSLAAALVQGLRAHPALA